MTTNLISYPKSEKRIEIAAVVLNLAYTALYLIGLGEAFILAFAGSALFVWLCVKRNILAEALLQVFYIVMAVLGWLHFSDGIAMSQMPSSIHFGFIGVAIIVWISSGVLLKKRIRSAHPFVDSFTTTFSVVATLFMIKGDPYNWWYWLVIDTIAIWLYYKRGLYFGAGMFAIYLILAIIGIVKEFL